MLDAGGLGDRPKQIGFALDNTVSYDVVRAWDGANGTEVVTVSADEEEGLFWGLKGKSNI